MPCTTCHTPTTAYAIARISYCWLYNTCTSQVSCLTVTTTNNWLRHIQLHYFHIHAPNPDFIHSRQENLRLSAVYRPCCCHAAIASCLLLANNLWRLVLSAVSPQPRSPCAHSASDNVWIAGPEECIRFNIQTRVSCKSGIRSFRNTWISKHYLSWDILGERSLGVTTEFVHCNR